MEKSADSTLKSVMITLKINSPMKHVGMDVIY